MEPNQSGRWIRLAGVLFWGLILLSWLMPLFFPVRELSYSEFRASLKEDRVASVAVSAENIQGELKPKPPEKEERFRTVRVEDPDLLRELQAHGVKVTGIPPSPWKSLLPWMFVLAIPLAFFLFSRRGGSRPGFMTIGQNKAKVYAEKDIAVRFSDVAGVDEAKEELQEVIEFLKTPEKFRRLGGKIPKGILLVGPPGTGKTLLARAVAGEAGVPFFTMSGSEFVELFVGLGAARVRDLFVQARQRAPCIIFIDELDALGKARGQGPVTHEEREQTLNQLLVEMDGFDPKVGVILMAATNRPEILDPALLRAGRFDRHVLVDRPDKIGRLEILKVHAKNVPLDDPSALESVAGMTAGMVGADMANIINEAALLAVRRGKETVGRAELEESVERVISGLEKRNRVLNRAERERVAHHEIGHALVALSMPGADPVKKISIIPRGIAALGYTIQVPTEDRFLMTQSELENRIAVLLGGRTAELLVFNEPSTGAQDDLQKATAIARSMVTTYGMSPRLGGVTYHRENRSVFLEAEGERSEYSEEYARLIDAEVERIVGEQQTRVQKLLRDQLATLQTAARELLVRETLTGADLQAVRASAERGSQSAA
jgi:cell division protease FtsH